MLAGARAANAVIADETTELYLRELLNYPENCRLEAILSLGKPRCHAARQELSSLPSDKIHWNSF